ncbi:hypothetical protein [Colwellia psychrerythraea]|uniref:Lipoprotein n=1 Tax=Colwellia psychrerythraea TaxID=28229 RepID=A0A099KSG4_COLPS|nr:hypothetical protein [Colwellia psychrerythraea]KGJ93481.1 hypothetical protein GAB14E_2589 [Colwellia psychrerythraea]
MKKNVSVLSGEDHKLQLAFAPLSLILAYNFCLLTGRYMQYGDRMKYICFIILFILTGCSSSTFYAGGKGVENSIRKSVVKGYTNNEVFKLGASQVGYVEAEYCRINNRDSIVSQSYLIDILKVKTQKLGGNGLVFDSCLVHINATCISYTKCQGMAYLITYK